MVLAHLVVIEEILQGKAARLDADLMRLILWDGPRFLGVQFATKL